MTDKGFTDKVQGKAKELAGKATGNDQKKAEGILDQAVGKAKEVVSGAKDVIEEVAEKAKDKLNDK